MGANTSSSSYPTVASSGSGANSNASNSNGNLSAMPPGMGEMPGGGGGCSGAFGSSSSCGPSGNAGATPGIVINGAHYHRDQRRKRATGFATLKRKFIRRRRSSKACDHARVLRDFVSDWAPVELAALCEEFEALSALRDLSVQAELARPPAATFKQDLAAIYEKNLCTDCDLVFRGTIFSVHRAILSARCVYFRDLLAGCPGFGARICLELPTSPIDVQLFSSLLRYLYTGDLCPHDPNIDITLLRQLGKDFGTPNPLEHDLRYLLETGDYADAALVFTADGSNDYLRQDSGTSEYGFRPKIELPCHKAILSARSPFFRNLIARRTRNMDEYVERSLHVPTRIVLDETVIPKRYARVLLQAIYLDSVDLSLILRGVGSGTSAGSLGEVHALTNTGRVRPTTLEEAMELYQIGRFLELDILAQGCEDLILEWLSIDTLPIVLKWGCQPHGSAWVFRQACQYLREEFAAVSSSPVLHQLDKSQLIHILHSNFLQASELEVLQAVLKWGEQELIRRMEDREPNLLSHTAHSVARKGVKKRDLSDIELREILSELLPLVRMDHVLPPHCEVLCQAIRRGLVSTPPSHMIGDDRENLRINAWIRGGKNQGLYVRPRLFMPYFEEVKALLEDRMSSSHHQVELMRMRRCRHPPDIPDTLYMVSHMNSKANSDLSTVENRSTDGNVDILVGAAVIPPPDNQTLLAMRKREHKLRQSPMCQRALLLPLSSKSEIDRQIRLRVVREFNLPDEVSDLLEIALQTNPGRNESHAEETSASVSQKDDSLLEDEDQSPPPSPAATCSVSRHTTVASSFLSPMGSSVASCGTDAAHPCYSRNLTFPRHHSNGLIGVANAFGSSSGPTLQCSYSRLSSSVHQRNDLPALITEGDFRFPHGNGLGLDMGAEGGACGLDTANSHLSEMMPDVAMATASLGQLHLTNNGAGCAGNIGGRAVSSNNDMSESLQLDLGDGPSPHIIGSAVGSMTLRNIQHQLPTNNYHHFMQRSNSPFEILRQGQPSPTSHPQHSGTYNSGPPRFL
ncbi:BTB/POZ domain-containing protein 7 [Drosophila santomea]|uniref:BTB/POZ domain-containing protein 7 n=1 Tax=Drosophila santomea TaxID=129105 RepID=UPI001952A597|nr:BTB/POZ domain-containing protein 7 [Drosophila santomea]XP_039498291.1 BTB/POZ domain-containing protein 7 [Drosophila santomea]XP_039498292.1 BTB/POZ domain-containing protein 7 [Drosophila santomea]XP_039498293.1 BTB/POZ domain-containing protein 7 [Drosophila santomea]XP_039498294.1 BTB/POZ domain-containing protein 7 [Drosophila santomea]